MRKFTPALSKMSRESRVKKAKLAEQAERYEDMVQEMNEVVTAGTFILLFAAVSGCSHRHAA